MVSTPQKGAPKFNCTVGGLQPVIHEISDEYSIFINMKKT